MLCQTLTLLADAPTTDTPQHTHAHTHPLEPLLASIWPKETGLIFYLACSENLPEGTPLRPLTMGQLGSRSLFAFQLAENVTMKWNVLHELLQQHLISAYLDGTSSSNLCFHGNVWNGMPEAESLQRS